MEIKNKLRRDWLISMESLDTVEGTVDRFIYDLTGTGGPLGQPEEYHTLSNTWPDGRLANSALRERNFSDEETELLQVEYDKLLKARKAFKDYLMTRFVHHITES